MRAMMRQFVTGTALTAVMLSTLAGCGASPSAMNGGRTAGSFGAANTVDGPDLPMNQLPAETVVVPDRPTRAPQPYTKGNAGKLFVGPPETLSAVLGLINGAKKSIYLETFNMGWESYGEKLVPLLIAKAQSGVEVKIVMDYIGSRFLANHKAMVKQLRAGGVEVRIYRPRTVIKDDKRIGVNITHRKIYLADGTRGLVGGVNLMKEFDTTSQDVLIEWRGPVISQLYAEFARDWHTAGGSTLHQQPVDTGNQGKVDAQVILTSPGEGRFEAKEVIFRQLENAQRNIEIEQQYICDDQMITRLHAAVKRGVKVRIIMPEPTHTFVFTNIHMEEMNKLVKEGAEARMYHGNPADAHLHAKYVNVDDRWTMCGSINLDTRALIENQELAVAFTDRELILNMKQRLFERDWSSHSDPFVYKPGSWVMKPVRSLLELLDYYI
ncbi:MAG: phospholipase D-like domain-containing protein [Candidatus Sericytochromatia bacterium]